MIARVTATEIRALLILADADEQSQARGSAPRATRQAEAKVPIAILQRYQALVERGLWPALAAAREGCCTGCNLRLPMVLDQQIRRAPAIFACPSCQRLLYGAAHLEPTLEARQPRSGKRPPARRPPSRIA